MAKPLTDLAVRNAKPKNGKGYERPDGGSLGLYLNVQTSGARSWTVRYRHAGRSRKLTLGSADLITLAEARAQATAARLQVARGIDPIQLKNAEKEAARKDALERSGNSVERLFGLYFADHCLKHMRVNTQRSIAGVFRHEVLPRWAKRQIGDVSRTEVKELVRSIATKRPAMAAKVQAHLSAFFGWCEYEEYITESPCLRLKSLKQAPRQRHLKGEEIRTFWHACADLPEPFGDVFKLLLLTGARRQEVADMAWEEIDLEKQIWILPAERAKNKLPHAFPLRSMAWDILEKYKKQPLVGYVFGSPRGFSHRKRLLDAAMKLDEKWQARDLRRTARGLMSMAGVGENIAERMVCHLPKALIRTYNVYDFEKEKRAGFEALEQEIRAILNIPRGNVVPMHR